MYYIHAVSTIKSTSQRYKMTIFNIKTLLQLKYLTKENYEIVSY